MRALLAVVGGVLVGLAAGAVWTWLQADRYRADARMLVRPSSSRIVPAVEALAESSLVESNVAQTLHLSSPPHLSAQEGKGGVLTLSVEAGSRERARQIDAEAVVVVTQKVEQRFGTSVAVRVTLLDPAHAAEQTSPTTGRNFLIAGLLGLAAGLATSFGFRPGRRRDVEDPGVVSRLHARIDAVAKREHALARRAGEFAVREQQLEGREREVAAAAARSSKNEQATERRAQELDLHRQELEHRAADLSAREAELAAAAAAKPEPLSAAPESATVGGWDLHVLERLVQQQSAVDPAVKEELSTYLFFLRQHSDQDGLLPSTFDSLIADVFGSVPGVLSHAPREQ